jgi:hypothetical protein
MAYFIFLILGVAAGAFCAYIALDRMRKAVMSQQKINENNANKVREAWQKVESKQADLAAAEQSLRQLQSDLDSRHVTYSELERENAIIKADLRNLAIKTRKLQLDGQLLARTQAEVSVQSAELASLYLQENVKWIGAGLTPTNFANSKTRLQKVVERCRKIGFQISADEEDALFAELRKNYELVVRAAFEKEEQARIRAQIREEQQRERELQRELQQLEREREAIAAALAIAEAEHSQEVDSLRVRLAEAESRTQRAISQAQITKAGHVYVISNIGSFGENVFKIGMTRRLEPGDRVLELSGAAVPFPFDVHMMISCNDAPALEATLHRRFHGTRLNKANPRKEFFRATMGEIAAVVREHQGEVSYIVDAEALQYRQSLEMSSEDQEYIERVFEELDEEAEVTLED